jgi:hypothetical protein
MKNRKIGNVLELTVNIPLWIVLAIGVVVAVVVYFSAPQHRDDLKFIAVLAGGATAIYSAYYVGAALRMGIQREKQRGSFEILSLLNRPEFVEVRHFLEKDVEGYEKLSAADLYSKIQNDTKLENAVTIVLGILEDASIAIQQEYVSEVFLYLSIADIAKRNFRGLRGYIDQLRKVRNVPFFIELERLVNAWEAGRRLSDGKPLPPISVALVQTK